MAIKDVTHKYLKSGRSWIQRDVKTISKITVHHTANPRLDDKHDEIMRSEMSTHVDKNGWPGLSYHYIIFPDGTIYKINNHEDVTWHDTYNFDSLAVCLQGYFHTPHNQKPTKEQLLSLKALLDELCTLHPEFPADQDDVLGHRERSVTACPGDLFFPYVVEYRTKLGDVNWGISEPIKYNLDEDIPSEVESAHELKEYDRYDKHWSFNDLIKDWTLLNKDLGRVDSIVENAKNALTETYNDNLQKLIETHKDQMFTKDQMMLTLQNELDETRLEVERLKNQHFSLPEAITFLTSALRNFKVKSKHEPRDIKDTNPSDSE